MSSVTPSGSSIAYGGAGRRLAAGLLLSLLAHALVLTLQFGVPGFGPGPAAPLHVVLAPAVPVTAAPADQLALAHPEPAAAPAPAVSGLRLVERAPEPDPPPPPPRAPAPAATQRVRPRRAGAARAAQPPPVPVIASESGDAAAFAMPPPPASADAATDLPAVQEDGAPGEGGVAVTQEPGADGLAADDPQEAQEAQVQAGLAAEALRDREEQARLSLVREQEEARAAAQAQALALAQQRAAEQERLLARQQEADRERVLAQQLLDDRQREQQAREAAIALAARRQAEDEAIRRETEATAARQRVAQLAVQQEQEEVARRQAAEAARQLAQDAARRVAEEKAPREANEAARLAADQAAVRRQPVQATPGTGAGDDPFAEGGGGAMPTRPDGGLAGRARELVRGLQIPGAVPHVLRPAADARAGRRIVVAGNERDVPLRMYVDSFRQKIERNAALHHMPDRVRIDPLVSVSLHSDGSVGEVSILRSSGRPDMDQAVLRMVRLNARYSVFPPHVAAQYDVIEIRRIWSFAEGLKLLDEVR